MFEKDEGVVAQEVRLELSPVLPNIVSPLIDLYFIARPVPKRSEAKMIAMLNPMNDRFVLSM